jgi:hypothetical protein
MLRYGKTKHAARLTGAENEFPPAFPHDYLEIRLDAIPGAY